MKAKSLGLSIVSIFAVILLMGLASAVLTIDQDSIVFPPTIDHDAESFDVTFDVVNENVDDAVTVAWSDTTTTGTFTVVHSATTTIPAATVVNETTVPAVVTITATVSFDSLQSGTLAGEIVETTLGLTAPFSVAINDAPALSVSSPSISEGDTTATITLTNNGNIPLTNIQFTALTGDMTISDFDPEGFTLGVESTPQDVVVTLDSSNLEVGSNSVTISTSATGLTSPVVSHITAEGSFCNAAEDLVGSFDIIIDEIKVIEGFGDDDDFWYPFDEIEVELEIEPGNYDIENIEVEWALYTESGDKIDDGDEADFNLDEDDDDEKITITFKLDRKLNRLDGENTLILYVSATGRVDDKHAPSDIDGEDTCVTEDQEIDLVTNDEFVILDDINFPEVLACGEDYQLTAEVWNVDSRDMDDVSILITNKDLGINKEIPIGDIDTFDDKKLTTTISIPGNAPSGTYALIVKALDDNGDVFKNDEDDESRFNVVFDIESGCSGGDNDGVDGDVFVNAKLESGGEAGKQLVVKVTVTNIGSDFQAYGLSASGYSDWASDLEISSKTVVLDVGDSKEILFTFEVDKDVSGEQSFTVEVSDAQGNLVTSQPASVMIEGKGGGITGGIIGSGSGYLWGIGLLNIILVVIIIIVAVRVARR